MTVDPRPELSLTRRPGGADRVLRWAPWAVAVTFLVVSVWVARIAIHRDAGGSEVDGPAEPLVHIHGLVADTASVLVGTHRGLFRVSADGAVVMKVGDHSRDLMGLALGADGSLFASGHPDMADRRAGADANLGLLRSDDGGRTWSEVGVANGSDLHEIVVIDDELVAWDANSAQLVASSDGRRWEPRRSMELRDLAYDESSGQLVAVHSLGVDVSVDRGRTWRNASTSTFRAITASSGTWYAIDDRGAVWASRTLDAWVPFDKGAHGAVAIVAADDQVWIGIDEGLTSRVFELSSAPPSNDGLVSDRER